MLSGSMRSSAGMSTDAFSSSLSLYLSLSLSHTDHAGAADCGMNRCHVVCLLFVLCSEETDRVVRSVPRLRVHE